MKKKVLITLLGFLSSLFANEKLIDEELSKKKIIDRQENYFLTSTDYRIPLKVNPITGEYSDEEEDIVIAGSEPLSLRRFYSHLAPYNPRYASWRYNPECCLVANFDLQCQPIFASIGEKDGSISSFKRSQNDQHAFIFDMPKGFTTSHTTGQNHPGNTIIQYSTKGDKKNKYRFEYHGTIKDGSGRVRTFKSPLHSWNNSIEYTLKKDFPSWRRTTFEIRPATWTPYHLLIEEERLPNGNIICYTYAKWQKSLDYPKPELLTSITAYNSNKTKVLSSLQFKYQKTKHEEVAGIMVTGSDERWIYFHHTHGEHPIRLGSVERVDQPDVYYGFYGNKISTVEKPEGRIFKTKYKNDKVIAQYAPVGPNGEMLVIAAYEYLNKQTIVSDAEGHRTIYCYDDDQRIVSVQTPVHITHFEWDTTTGNLLGKTLKDLKGNTVQISEFQYDKNFNPIVEKWGDGTNWHTIYRSYSDDGFNLKLTESDQANKLIRYSYVPNTNLLASELFLEGQTIRRREFHFYDDCAIRIKTIVDDGVTENPFDLEGVTYRKITEISPKQQMPCFGLPEVIQEKTIDESGKERLLKKVVFSYTAFGKVLKEDHYDSLGEYRYSVVNEYNEKEQLIAKTDGLGNKVSFAYDANYNLLSTTGPREDQRKEIVYDKVNRPIQIIERQSDGTSLCYKKSYDKIGNVISEIDPCGYETRFAYDALGRIVAVYHPDGAVERKDYDILGNVIKEIDALGYETIRTYNYRNQPLTVCYPDGSFESFTYNVSGTMKSSIDKNGMTCLYTYDIFNNLIRTDSSKTTSAKYSSFTKLSETDGEGIITFYSYDFAGRRIGEKQSYKTIHYAYDTLGRCLETREGENRTIEDRDLLDRIICKRVLNGNSIQNQEEYRYDKAGNRTHVINSQGQTETTYNSIGKPLSIKDALGFTTSYSYSYQGNFVQKITNPKGIQTIGIYDERGREMEFLKKNAQGETIQKSKNRFDKNGNLAEVTHTVFSGKTALKTIIHQWFYGPMNRLERFLESGEKETKYFYDEKGRLKVVVKADGTPLHHEYDELGRLSRYFAHDFDYDYSYDQNDRVIAIFDRVSGQTSSRHYDDLSCITEEILGNGVILKSSFDENGRRKKLTLPDNSNVNYTYDGVYLHTVSRNGYHHSYDVRNLEGEILEYSLPASLGRIAIKRDSLGRYQEFHSPFYSEIYPQNAYDSQGNLLQYTYYDQLGHEQCQYSYDDLDQLLSENNHTYFCDSIYNRIKKDDKENSVNALCQITNDGEHDYIYDKCGNLIWDGIRRYSYDSQDRLISTQEDDQHIEYTYDPFHRRLTKKTSTEQLAYIWDGENEIGTLNEQNKISQLRVLGEGLGAEIGSTILIELDERIYVPIHDHRGSIVTLVDVETKNAKECYRYNAFGEELTNNSVSPWRFASKRVDESGCLFFGRRYYCPSLGRWLTQDPEGYEDGPNLYAYVQNNPVILFDLYGLNTSERGIFNFFYDKFQNFNFPEKTSRISGCTHLMPDFEAGYKVKSSEYSLKNYMSLPNGHIDVGFVNGILNNFGSAVGGAQYLSRLLGGINVEGTHNQSDGFDDIRETALNLYHFKMTPPCLLLRDKWKRKFDNDPNGKPFFQACHSQGTAIVRNALMHSPEEIRKRIVVCAIAPSAYIPKHLCLKAYHGVSTRDIVPLLDSKGRKACKDSITLLKPHRKAKFIDHEFTSQTYESFIRDAYNQYKKDYVDKK